MSGSPNNLNEIIRGLVIPSHDTRRGDQGENVTVYPYEGPILANQIT